MAISVDGNSITITNCTITVDNAFDQTTGVATITITPSGGLGTLPALLDGQPGLPPALQIGTVSTLSAGSSATATLIELSPGGPGAASTYQLNLGIPAGAAGSTGSFLIQNATDLVNGAFGAIQNDWTLFWNSVTGKFNPAPLAVPHTYYASSINSTSGTGAGPRTLTSVVVPAQNYDWVPQPLSSCVVNGTANTQVNLQAFVGTTAGTLVGVDYGISGQTEQTLRLLGALPGGASTPVITAGNTATILLCATQVASTTDAWSTASGTTSFSVTTIPHGIG